MDPFIKLPRVPVYPNRHDFVLERCADKRVLHIGCVDAGLLEQRFERGQLMHQRMDKIAQDLWGADIDVEGIDFLRSKGFDNLIVTDASDIGEQPELRGKDFDVIVASELMEHLSNPGLFLNSVKQLITPGRTELIITVPNAFRLRTLGWLLRGIEYVHPDHNYWFSYHTITNLLRKHGYAVQTVAAYSFLLPEPSRKSKIWTVLRRIRRGWKVWIALALLRTTSFWGDGLMVVAKVPLPDEAGTTATFS